jgi:uncharacterized phiE125 gp8 family phage protein
MAWYSPKITVSADSEPITLAEAKAQCRVDGADEDTLIEGYIASARAYVEAYTGTFLKQQTVTVKCDGFADFAKFSAVPLGSVSSISYVDGAGATQTLSANIYEVRSDGLKASIALKGGQIWPTIQNGSRITVTADVGYSSVPSAVKLALLLLVSQWYDNRAAAAERGQSELPFAISSLLANHQAFAF